jgi:hypothetical protein
MKSQVTVRPPRCEPLQLRCVQAADFRTAPTE